MSEPLIFPEKYYIVWLDAHIGDPEVCIHLKRAFFTHIDPESGNEVCPSDKDISRFILSESGIPVEFDSFNCTLRGFNNEVDCLKYIDEIQDNRILFIASSKLGESAVKKLMDKYTHSFTDKKTNKPYASIYIFCTDVEIAYEWSAPYGEYVHIFDFDTDLLGRMTKDVAEEFLDHGKQLLQANQYEAALERFSWSKSLYIRHEKLKFPSNPNTPLLSSYQSKSSQKIQEIDAFIETVETQLKQQSEDDSHQDDSQMGTSTKEVISSDADHLIIFLKEPFSSFEQMKIENEYTIAASDSTHVQNDNSIIQHIVQFQNQWKLYLSNIPANIKNFDNIDDCHQCITENDNTKAIFLVMFDSIAEKILLHMNETHNSIKKIYTSNECIKKYINWIIQYQQENINIRLFDSYEEILIQLLKDIGQYYLLKGENHQKSLSSSDESTLIYFDWAEEIVSRAQQMTCDQYQNKLNNIKKAKNERKKSLKKTISKSSMEEQIENYNYRLKEDSDSVAIIFIVGSEIKVIDLASDVAQLLTCDTNEKIQSVINNVKLERPFIIVSSTLPSDHLMTLKKLLCYYYYIEKPDQSVQNLTKKYSNFSFTLSTPHLLNQLHHKLAQYYRDSAIKTSTETKDQNKAKRLLERSTQCYKLLEDDTKETLKHYAEILKNKKNIP